MAEYEPFIIERAEGCIVYDIDGRAYIDAISNLWCNIHGHRHPKIDAAIREQLERVAHVTSLGASNSAPIVLCKRLADLAPPGLTRVFLSDNGATSVEVAIKMAMQYWRQRKNPRPEKTGYVALGDAYHGDTLGCVSVGGIERFHATFQPLLFKTSRLPAVDSYRLPEGVTAEMLCDYHLGLLEETLAECGAELAAVIVEPMIQAAAGMIMHPKGYLRGVRELTKKYDVLMIADEVAVGFGRTGKMFACEHEEVSPDLMCVAKGITGGYLPVAATLATDEIWNAFLGTAAEGKTFYHGHTYGGNCLGAAAALAVLDVFAEEKTLEGLPEKIARIDSHLKRIAALPHVGDARQRGMIAAVELVQDKATKAPFEFSERRGRRVCQYAVEHGVWLRPLGDVIVVMPPLCISLEQIDEIMNAVEAGILAAVKP